MLSERQQRIMRLVAGSYVETGQPVGSRAIAAQAEVAWSASTIRAELAALEDDGYLTHPHTSAGRVPTETGYRFFAEDLLARERAPEPGSAVELELSRLRREVDTAMRETSTALAQITDLMALVTAPPLATTTIHRVEVLLLQPRVVLVVVITSAGGVTKRAHTFDADVDPGVVEWAASYLNERITGIALGALTLGSRLEALELDETERGFLAALAPSFTDLDAADEETLYVDGTAQLLARGDEAGAGGLEDVLGALERRASLLRTLRSALDERSVFLWIGTENPTPELRSMSIVGANYGLGHRNLGAVGVIGPMRMDYRNAIACVRDAAAELSRFVETVYDA